MTAILNGRSFLLLCSLLALLPAVCSAHPHIVDIAGNAEVSPDALLEDLKRVQVVFMGEFHDHEGHHEAQLEIIDALDDDDRPLAVGLEMFRRDSQQSLDRWTANQLPLPEFLEVYRDNWSMWPKYSRIFLHARSQELPLLGLNIPRSITRKVASMGFQALSAEERQLLGDVQCVVNPDYSRYIDQAMGGFGGHGTQYQYFCEAQLLWDTMMARNLTAFLKENKDYRVVVLAGSGHAWKFGIPRQMLKQANISYRVILPEVFSRFDRHNATTEIADYLWLDEGDDGWTFSR